MTAQLALTGAIIAAEAPYLYSAQTAADATLVNVITKTVPSYRYNQSAAFATSGGTLEVPICIAEANMAITSASIVSGATTAANSSTYATFTLEQSDPAGTITAVGAGTDTTGVALTKCVPRALSITPASSVVPVGNQIVLKVANTLGATVGPFTLIVNGVYT